jgi:hypothetical protein
MQFYNFMLLTLHSVEFQYFNHFNESSKIPNCAGLMLLCSEELPDDGTPAPKHVGVLYLLLNVFY